MAGWSKARAAVVALPVLLSIHGSAAAATPPVPAEFARSICAAVEKAATENGLDRSFFARLLWRESLFDPNAVSPKGAQGIAQFMPGTAERRNLPDPFEPLAAVAASASFLADLSKQFGNLGLAAAAYNAGEERVTGWLTGKRTLSAETEDYVAFVTGRGADEWKSRAAAFPIPPLGLVGDFAAQCTALAARQTTPPETAVGLGPRRPYGVLLAASQSRGKALAMYRRLKLRFPALLKDESPMLASKRNLSLGSRRMSLVMVGAESLAEARQICNRYKAAGLPCVARKNR